MTADIKNTIIDYISETRKIPKEDISEFSTVNDFPQIESIDIVELLAYIEDRFGIYVPDNEVIKMHSLGELIDYVITHAKNPE